jgi:hypothetical protein
VCSFQGQREWRRCGATVQVPKIQAAGHVGQLHQVEFHQIPDRQEWPAGGAIFADHKSVGHCEEY